MIPMLNRRSLCKACFVSSLLIVVLCLTISESRPQLGESCGKQPEPEKAKRGPGEALSGEQALQDGLAQLALSADQLAKTARSLQEVAKEASILSDALTKGEFKFSTKESAVPLVFIYVPPGNFFLGYNEVDKKRLAEETKNVMFADDSMPIVGVRMSEGYFILDREVTVKQFNAYQQATGKKGLSVDSENAELPVRDISWRDAMKFCQWLQGETNSVIRLPSEIEWEYAARGPWVQRYPWPGSDFFAWAGKAGDVGPRPLILTASRDLSWRGIHDMGGNLSEWCLDVFIADRYRSLGKLYIHSPSDPKVPETPKGESNPRRVYRGGSFKDQKENCEVCVRRELNEDKSSPAIGFRPVLLLKRPGREKGGEK